MNRDIIPHRTGGGQKGPNARLIAAVVCICLLTVLAVIQAVQVTDLAGQTRNEAARTPTPVPPYGNVMAVTPDPDAPTTPPVLRGGSSGEAVTLLQGRLRDLGYYDGEIDGRYGVGTKAAVKAFQQENDLDADGLFGAETSAVLYSSDAKAAPAAPTAVPEGAASRVLRWLLPAAHAEETRATVRSGSKGDDVTALQEKLRELGWLDEAPDGIFGSTTKKALQRFQRAADLNADGICGPKTWAALTGGSAPVLTPVPTADPNDLPGMTDDGYPLLVNSEHPLPDDYTPKRLVSMSEYCDSSVVKIKYGDTQGEQASVDALIVMLKAARADGVKTWQVSAAYRSLEYQTKLFNARVQTLTKKGWSKAKATASVQKSVAVPGCSEHHTGLAFDITVPGASFGGTKQAKWLAAHCWEYGFIIRYPSGKSSITGISYEPWHIRWVGTEHAQRMHDEDLVLEEYIAKYADP